MKIIVLTLIIAIGLGCSIPGMAQSVEDRQQNADLMSKEAAARKAAADADKAKADAEKAQADADKAKLDLANAKVGQIDTKLLPSASFTINDQGRVVLESQVLAYRSINKIAASIAQKINAKAGQLNVVAITPAELNQIRLYEPFKFQLEQVRNQASQVSFPPPAAASLDLKACPTQRGVFLEVVPAPLEIATAAIQLASLFKTETTISPVAVTKNDSAVLNAVVAQLNKSTVFNAMVPKPNSQSSELLKSVAALMDTAGKLGNQALNHRNMANAVALKAKDKSFEKCQDLFIADQKRLEAAATKTDVAVAAIMQALSTLQKTDDQSGARLLDSLLRAEQLSASDLMLQVQIVEAGGTTIAREHFFGGSAKFSGGAVLTYLLTNKQGEVEAGGTYPLFGGRKSESQMVAEDKLP